MGIGSPIAAPRAGWDPSQLPGTGDAELIAFARARPELAWQPGTDIALGRNAHRTNTREELAAALRGDFTWLEGDVRMGARGPEMRHDEAAHAELSTERWLAIVKESGRGAKLDLKDRASLPAVLDAVRRSGIDEGRIIINVGDWPAPLLQSIRRVLPNVLVNITPETAVDLTAGDIVRLQLSARIVGGPAMFPIREDLVDAGVVRALRPYGKVAVWNSPGITSAGRDDERRMRELGVDGMVDLRAAQGLLQRASAAAVGMAANLFGWAPVHHALDAVGLI